MALSQQEEMELAEIESELNSRSNPSQASGLSQEEEFELAEIEQELTSRQGQETAQVNSAKEADLGFANRARYSIEPLESNRMALLAQEFGEENVMQDKSGNLYINQNGQFRPVNKDGFSFADVANFAGATPEMAGGLVGSVAGMVGGAGVASIPGAIALGAGGGALGSVARQALSATLGTPQVATIGERATETGLSAALSGVFSGVGQGIKQSAPAIKKVGGEAFEAVSKVFKRSSPAPAREVLENSAKFSIAPEVVEETVQNAGEEVLSRDLVKEQVGKLAEISKRQNLPVATYAQAAGGKAIQAEDKILNTPLIGGKIRKQVDNQLKAVKSNLEKNVGKFIDEDSTGLEVGLTTKDLAGGIVKSTKKASQDLYSYVEEAGKDAMIGKKTFLNKFRDKSGEWGLLDLDPESKLGFRAAPYRADSGFTREEFGKLQRTMMDGINAIHGTGSPKIRFQSVNALRKTVNNTANELKASNPNAARILKQFGKELDSVTEGVLNREAPKLGEAFGEANKKWAQYKNDSEFLDKFLPDGVENIVKKTMNNTDNIKRMKELVGDNHVKEIGKSYVKDILGGLSKSGVARADSALTAIKKNKAQIIESLGEDTYKNLTDNLYYLNRLNQPMSVSRPSMYSLLFSPQSDFNLKKLVVNVATSAKSYTEMQGMGVKDVAKKAGENLSKPITVPFKRIIESGPAKQGAAGNVLTDAKQRSGAYFVRGPVAKKDEEDSRSVAGKKFTRKR